MLTSDLVRYRRYKDRLIVRGIPDGDRERILEIAVGLIAAVEASVGQPRDGLLAACRRVPALPGDKRLVDGLVKLLTDRCDFEMVVGHEPPALREAVFVAASAARQSLAAGERFDRAAILGAVAAELALEPAVLEAALFADLKAAHILMAFEPITAAALLDRYTLANEQAVLLKAVQVVAEVHEDDAGAYRALFRTLKFRRLLHTIEPLQGGGYRITLDGPHSLFQATGKYGLQLALMLPTLRACARWKINADLRWGKERQALTFELEGTRTGTEEVPATAMPDEVQKLVRQIRKKPRGWTVRRSAKILNLPGVGLCVPDVVFSHTDHPKKVYLEVMGYWSREAVWKRVDLVEAGMKTPVLFAVSSRLRVSEAVLGEDLPSQLYVYKGALSARTVLERVERLAAAS